MKTNAPGNLVTYELPASRLPNRMPIVFICVGVAAIVGAALLQHLHLLQAAGSLLAGGLGSMLFGVNTVAYETPVTGATAPTATQSRTHQSLSAVVTGDGAATSFTITHNWGLSAAELTASWPVVDYEYLLAAGYTAAALINVKSTNAVSFTCTAFTGAGLRVRLMRPWTALR